MDQDLADLADWRLFAHPLPTVGVDAAYRITVAVP
jgi:hypothetical protein